MDTLALFGGSHAVYDIPDELFRWPIITAEDEQAVLDVLRRGAMSGTDVTMAFEKDFAAWQGRDYALGFCNGTMALHAAMFGVQLGKDDELLCPSKTYWGSCMQAVSLGAKVVFTDIEEHSLCLDPSDIEHRITPKTRAIMVVHYYGHPADMDRITAIAGRHNLKIIEDVSHAHGGLYKGRKLGTFGHVAAMSMMSTKAFAIGEAGMLVTDDKLIFERAIAFAHYNRLNDKEVTSPALLAHGGLPLGGMKGRMNQTCSAMGRVQLKYFDERSREMRRAMNYFWDGLRGIKGLTAHRTDERDGSTMGGWYRPHGIYKPEELGGLPLEEFCAAMKAEGCSLTPYGNFPLHTHLYFSGGKPTERLPISEDLPIVTVPCFRKYLPEHIDKYIHAFQKVSHHYQTRS